MHLEMSCMTSVFPSLLREVMVKIQRELLLTTPCSQAGVKGKVILPFFMSEDFYQFIKLLLLLKRV